MVKIKRKMVWPPKNQLKPKVPKFVKNPKIKIFRNSIMAFKKPQKMPRLVQDMFGPKWKEWLLEYDETGHFRGSETGEKPTRFAMEMMGFEETDIAKYYPSHKHSFITVRLNNETDLKTIEHKLHEIKLSWLGISTARLEVFGSDAQTHNHHIHFLTPPVNKTRAIRDMSRYFKVDKVMIDVAPPSDKCELYETRKEYLQGKKKELKSEAIDMDTKYLENLNIQQIYYINV